MNIFICTRIFSQNKITTYFLIRGSLIHLWPDGYKKEVEECCPSAELFQYVYDNYLDEVKAALPLRKSFLEMANKARSDIAVQIELPVQDITFIGLHDRYFNNFEIIRFCN